MDKSKGFTLIELVVVISIVAILVGLSTGLYKGYTKEAHKAEWKNNIKVLEQASEQYYMKHGEWPRVGDEYFTPSELETYSERIKDLTGGDAILDTDGKYYSIDYQEIAKYARIPKDKENYILQNPIGKVMYLENLTEAGKAELNTDSKSGDVQKAPIRPPEVGEIAIRTAEELIKIGVDENYPLNGKYIQMSNIDLGVAPHNTVKGWKPIGNLVNPFLGELDGNGFVISNLTINRPTEDNVGLIGYASTGTKISNVKLDNVSIVGNNNVGSLIGYNYSGGGVPEGGIIMESYATGNIYGNNSVGGLLGYNYSGGRMEKSYTVVNVIGSGNNIGGLTGVNWGLTISSYTSGEVHGTTQVGGIAGINMGGTILNSYSTASVKGSYVGGLAGANNSNGIITNSYSTGRVTGSTRGGIMGAHFSGTILGAYWDTETSGLTTSPVGIGKQTEEMKQKYIYENWDFNTIWEIQEGQSYPTLQWQK